MRINIDLIKESDIAHAIRINDIDEACLYLQTIAGITDGGIASICMSDTTFDWERDVEDREDMVRSWLQTEAAYAVADIVEIWPWGWTACRRGARGRAGRTGKEDGAPVLADEQPRACNGGRGGRVHGRRSGRPAARP
jgi:hypothetical protein